MAWQPQGGATEVDADAVLAWARARAQRGATLRTVELTVDPDPAERRMVGAARRHFGTWRAMLIAAGLELPPRGRTAPPTPTPAEVLAWVRDLAAAGTSLKSGWISAGPDPTPRRMLAAGRVHFGSWARTLEVAGVELVIERPPAEAVVAWIQDVVTRRGSVPRTPLELRRDEAAPEMVAAVRRHFGSWDGMLVAAGFAEQLREAAPLPRVGPRAEATVIPRDLPPARPAARAPVAAPVEPRAVAPSPPAAVSPPAAAAPPPPAAEPPPPAAPPPPAHATRRWLGAEVVLTPLPLTKRWAALEAEVAAALTDERHVPPGLLVLLTEALEADQAALVRPSLPALLVLLERQADLLELSALDARHRGFAEAVRALEGRGLAVPERLAALAQAWGAPATGRRGRRRRS